MKGKDILALGVIFGLAGGCGLSCGNHTSATLNGPTGTLVVFVGDTPICNLASMQLTITSATLTPQPTSGVQAVPVSLLLPGQSVTLELNSLRDSSALFTSTAVPVGTYSQLDLTVANPLLHVFNFTASPPSVAPLTAQLTSATIALPLNPALTINANSALALDLDFDLLASVDTDPITGQVTGVINPQFKVVPSTASGSNGLGVLENLHGLVHSVSATSSNTSFTGSFVLQEAGQSAPALTVEVNTGTAFVGVSDVSKLASGTFVEADGFVDSSGNIVARTVQAEAVENLGSNMAAFLGPVVSVTRVGGVATQFSLFVREEAPDTSSVVPLQQLMTVNVSNTTSFAVEGTALNPAVAQVNASAGATFTGPLGLDATAITPGQEVVAHGLFQSGAAGGPAILNVTAVFLRRQTLAGNFSSVEAVGSDGVTGGFAMLPCSGFFETPASTGVLAAEPVSILTFSQTNFVGVNSLNSLTASPTLLDKGILLLEPNLSQVGTVTLVAPNLVFVAEQVHQLP